jgi:hypothetical protein
MFKPTLFYTYKSVSTISWKNWYCRNGMGYTENAFDNIQFCLARINTRKGPLNSVDPYLMCYFIFSFLIPPPPSPVCRGPPSRAPSRAGRPSTTCRYLGHRPLPNNSCLGRRLPPCHGPPYPGTLALHPTRCVVDHGSILLVSFCQDVMQTGRAKPASLSSVLYTCMGRQGSITFSHLRHCFFSPLRFFSEKYQPKHKPLARCQYQVRAVLVSLISTHNTSDK